MFYVGHKLLSFISDRGFKLTQINGNQPHTFLSRVQGKSFLRISKF